MSNDITGLALNLPDGVDEVELHGLVCGLACGAPEEAPQQRLRTLADLLADESPAATMLHAALRELGQDGALDAVDPAVLPLLEFIAGTEAILASEDLSFAPLLPEDDARLQQRLGDLAQWCNDFLAGYGAVAGERPLSPEAGEVLTDLIKIAEVRPPAEQDSGLDGADLEAAEADYMEVLEYVRVAVMSLRWSVTPQAQEQPEAPD